MENYFMLWNVHLFIVYSNGVACHYLLDMREKGTYGTLISVACEWMLDGLFIYLFGSILNVFSKSNQWKDTKCRRPFQKARGFCRFLSWQRHSHTKLLCGMSFKAVFASTKADCDLVFVLMVTGVALTFFCAGNFVKFFMWSITVYYSEHLHCNKWLQCLWAHLSRMRREEAPLDN